MREGEGERGRGEEERGEGSEGTSITFGCFSENFITNIDPVTPTVVRNTVRNSSCNLWREPIKSRVEWMGDSDWFS